MYDSAEQSTIGRHVRDCLKHDDALRSANNTEDQENEAFFVFRG